MRQSLSDFFLPIENQFDSLTHKVMRCEYPGSWLLASGSQLS
jgi:hypothetical protein